jgi:hypothetical protein
MKRAIKRLIERLETTGVSAIKKVEVDKSTSTNKTKQKNENLYVRGNNNTGDSTHDEFSGHFGFHATDVFGAKQKLAIEIGNVDRVQINHMNVGESGESEVFENLASGDAKL